MDYMLPTPSEISLCELVAVAVMRMPNDMKAEVLALGLKVAPAELKSALVPAADALSVAIPAEFSAFAQKVRDDREAAAAAAKITVERKTERGARIAAGHERRRNAKVEAEALGPHGPETMAMPTTVSTVPSGVQEIVEGSAPKMAPTPGAFAPVANTLSSPAPAATARPASTVSPEVRLPTLAARLAPPLVIPKRPFEGGSDEPR